MKNSSIPSATVTQAATFTYALFSMKNWLGDWAKLNAESLWSAFVVSFIVYLLASFFHSNLGACYPTDCLISIIPIALIILTDFVFKEIAGASNLCPSCDGDFCYYTPGASNNIV
jgi:hypothetical protein